MAERDDMQRRYAYHEMSNKVEEQHNRRRRRAAPGEGGTGEVETFPELPRMGDRVVAASENPAAAKRRKRNEGGKDDNKPVVRRRGHKDTALDDAAAAVDDEQRKEQDSLLFIGSRTLLDDDDNQNFISFTSSNSLQPTMRSYRPTTERTRAAYEELLGVLAHKSLLGSHQSPSVLRDAAQETLSILLLDGDTTKSDDERHSALSQLLTQRPPTAPGGLSRTLLGRLVQLSQQLDDFVTQTSTQEETMRDGALQTGDGSSSKQLDEEMGVAVVFDDESDQGENDDDSDVDVNVVLDASSDEEDGNDPGNQHPNNNTPAIGEDEDKVVLTSNENETDKKTHRGSDRILSVHEIDAHFLQRQLSPHVPDADEAARVAQEVLDILEVGEGRKEGGVTDLRECENRLIVLLGLELAPTIKLLLNNRLRVWACVRLKRSQAEAERQAVMDRLLAVGGEEGAQVFKELNSRDRAQDWTRDRMKGFADTLKKAIKDGVKTEHDGSAAPLGGTSENDPDSMKMDEEEASKPKADELDLQVLAFKDGGHTMSNKSCTLSSKSWRAMHKGYEEVHVPPVRTPIPPGEKLIEISSLPKWTHGAFRGMERLNRVQSKLYDVALKRSIPLLLCAPTGAGKTNVACLCMLNILGQYRRENPDGTSSFDLDAFKIVYVAPMKALVQEVVKNFSQRLKDYNITVRELSGDSSLSRQQIAETQLLVTTPEKFDVVTRQGEGRAFTQLIKLVIIDEIHLLHDDRGPVLESIVARTIRQVETTAEPIRLVALSATLPNYVDVAAFLRVDPKEGLFFFDHSYRPVPLQMQYIGITETNAFKRFQLQNELCYEKAMAQRRNANQILIFVHSRAETGKTAKALRDLAVERDELASFVRDGSATQEILREESVSAKNADLRDVLSYGFAIHHAGMAREDRELVEDLFADRHVAVLCTTATLAWGVNLPAHAVIIKGTQIYDPAKGKWAELSPLDVLQMLGRAGRPQYDSEGEGIILTQHSELQYYLSLTNLQLPVESQLIKTLPDHLNAEIALGTIQSIAEAVDWLTYTFLYVRMLQNPQSYGISEESKVEDPRLFKRRLDLAHTAACILEKSHMVIYDRKSGSLVSTPLGRVASQFYITSESMAVYNRHMRSTMGDIDVLRLFSLSGEFRHITVREEEKLELSKLASRVPIPVKESPNEPSAKVNILLQAYISRLKLEGFALMADMAFIRQSAARIMRALFEISLRRKWATLSKLCLRMSIMVSFRVWGSQSPLRQFPNVPEIVARKLERKSDIEWDRYYDLTSSDLGELVGVPKLGRILHKLVHQYPRFEVSAQIQPLTRSLLRVELVLVAAFNFDIEVHGFQQLFHIMAEDVNGENVLHHEVFALRSRETDQEHVITFTVPILEPLQPAYFIRVISDKWLHSATVLPILFSNMILPAKFPPPTELLDLQPLLPQALGEEAFSRIFSVKEFNPIQTQTFHELFKTDRNCLILAPSGSGTTTCAIFAMLRMISTKADGRCVYVTPTEEIANNAVAEIQKVLGPLLPGNGVVKCTGETNADLKKLGASRVTVATVKQWDVLSRRWRQRKQVQSVCLFIFDELHFLGGEFGPSLEVVISRTRYMLNELSTVATGPARIVGFGASIANARDIGEWMGVSGKSLFNFPPKARPTPLEIYFQSFEQSNYSSRLMAMAKPVFNAVDRHLGSGSAIVFVPSRRQSQLTAIDLMTYRKNADEQPFLGVDEMVSELRDPALQQVLPSGVGYVHGAMVQSDYNRVIKLYDERKINVLVCPAEQCWKLRSTASLVVIMGTEAYDGKERRHVDYPITDLLRMIGRHSSGSSGKCVLLCHSPKKEYLKKLLHDPLPVESHLDSYLHDPLNAEVASKGISSMQDAIDYLTWSFMYRRLLKNPTYYSLRGMSSSHLSEHLSEMIESVVGALEESKCCKLTEEGDISPLNLGMIAAYYYVQYRTIELIASSITAKTKVRGVLEILSASWEFSALPVRYGEEKALKMLALRIPHAPPSGSPYDANTKCLVLLQCHFSRNAIPSDFRTDQEQILRESVNLIQAIVDVVSNNGWLKPALAAMELSQMLVQGLWNKDHPLKQIPHFTQEIVDRCLAHDGDEPVESVFDILNVDDDVRNNLLKLPEDKMADVAVFCNNYPSIEMSFSVSDPDDVVAGEPVQVVVNLEREIDEDLSDAEIAEIGKVSAPLFPIEKRDQWWIVIGDMSKNAVFALKRANFIQKSTVKLEFLAPEEPGDYKLSLFCMSDSYLGCDQEYSVELSVAAASDSEGDDDDDEENDDMK